MSGDQHADRRAELVRRMLEARGLGIEDRLMPVSRHGELAASLSQERMWFLDHTARRSFIHNVALGARLHGQLDRGAMQRAVDGVVARQEALRTSFWLAGGGVRQIIHPEVSVELGWYDLRAEDDPLAMAARLDRADARHTFDLARAPLLRATVLRLADDDHILLVTAHHAIWDGWSTGILVHELASCYQAAIRGRAPELPTLAVQGADWAAWERGHLTGATLRRHEEFWRAELAGVPTVHVPPVATDTTGVVEDGGALVTFTVSPPLTASLTELGRQHDATLYMVLLAGFTAVLHGATGEPDLTVGGLIANRVRPEIEGLIGYFVNMAPIRSTITGATTFDGHLRAVRSTTLGVQEHQVLPRGHILRSGQADRHVPFDASPYTVTFQLQTAPRATTDFGDLELEIVDRHARTSGFDLGVVLWQRQPDLSVFGGIRGWCEYRTDLFDEATVQRLMDRYLAVLEEVVRTPQARLAALPTGSAAELARSVLRSEPKTTPFSPLAFGRVGAARPDRVALLTDRSTTTFAELGTRTAGIAEQLLAASVGPGSLVAIALDDEPALMLAAVAGALSVGAAFTLVSPTTGAAGAGRRAPGPRPDVLITTEAPPDLAPGIRLLRIDDEIEGTWPFDDASLGIDAAALGRVTASGDGARAGTAASRACFDASVQSLVTAHRLSPTDVTGVLEPDAPAKIEALLASLVAGSSIVGIGLGDARDPVRVLARLDETGITVAHLRPTVIESLIQVDAPTGADRWALRTVVANGPLATATAVGWSRRFPGTRLLTELEVPGCAGVVARHEAGSPNLHRPVGLPVTGGSLSILDLHGSPVAPGATGELCIGGAPVGFGFAGDARRTAERFRPDPFGSVPGSRLVRTGLRVRRPELGPVDLMPCSGDEIEGEPVSCVELEAILQAHPHVDQAHVVARPDDDGIDRMIAYVATSVDALDAEAWRTLCPSPPIEPQPTDPLGTGPIRSTTWTEDVDDAPDGCYDLIEIGAPDSLAAGAHLLQLVERATARVRPLGRVVIRDVADLRLRRPAAAADVLARAGDQEPIGRLRAEVAWRLRHDATLAIDPFGFGRRCQTLPRVTEVDLVPAKAGDRIDDASVGARFDVVLHLDSPPARRSEPADQLGWDEVPSSLDALARDARRDVLVRSIPDRRSTRLRSIDRALAEPLPGATAGGLRAATARDETGLLPSDVASAAARHGARATFSLDPADAGRFQAWISYDGPGSAGGPSSEPVGGGRGAPAVPAEPQWSNDPGRMAARATLVPDLRRSVHDAVPTLLAPVTFVVLGALPMQADGRPDTKALPAPVHLGGRSRPHVGPRTSVERTLTTLWSDVLGIEGLGVTETPEELGLHAVQVALLAAATARALGPLAAEGFSRDDSVALVARRIDGSVAVGTQP